ncbi:PREDICTED: ephrin-A2-like [Aptenodytes forsteri]|uniref:ephrin-A2-like n=1 Tax=Aptenodytes forsteri TaxID=9233 RepID=UPI0009056EAA|nr:PREDICTED: ephrin-A2-like [Aptenodytes forsteri]
MPGCVERTNARFLRDDYAIQVAINDYLDIYCPHYEGYRGCYETPGAFKRWECNRPQAPFGPVRFSEKIQRFTPFSLGFEFQPGETYYYISPEPVTEVPNSQPHGRGGPEGEYKAGRWARGRPGAPGAGGRLSLTSALALADAVPARGIAAPLQPRAPCLALVLLTLLWI